MIRKYTWLMQYNCWLMQYNCNFLFFYRLTFGQHGQTRWQHNCLLPSCICKPSCFSNRYVIFCIYQIIKVTECRKSFEEPILIYTTGAFYSLLNLLFTEGKFWVILGIVNVLRTSQCTENQSMYWEPVTKRAAY